MLPRIKLSAASLALAALIAVPAWSAEVPREVKSEFRQNVVRRDRLVRELHSLDQKAADAVAGGKTPNATHAQQIELQDQIDLIQLRIETMAMRWNLDIPPQPTPGSAQMDEGAVTAQRIEGAFAEGRGRTDRALQERCLRMLGSIDYDTFLARAE